MHHPFEAIDSEWVDALFEKAPTPMALVDTDHRFARCNEAFCRLVGYSKSELLSRTWKSITHPDDLPGDESGAMSAQQDRRHPTYTVAKRYIAKRGEVVWVNLHVRGVWREDRFAGYLVHAIQSPPSRCEACPLDGRHPAPRETFIEWCKRNPKDAAIIALAGAAFLGRDEAVTLLKTLIK